jgi:hypothetical protein
MNANMNADMNARVMQNINTSGRVSCARGTDQRRNNAEGLDINRMSLLDHQQKQHQYPAPPRMITLTRLIVRHEWEAIENMLSLIPIKQIEIDKKGGLITEESVLHFALRYAAPLHLVKLLALKYPLCLTMSDPTGKYACHVACKYGALPSVLEFLVRENAHAAGIQDPEGKTPIHYVGEFYASNYESPSSLAVRESMLQVIHILRQAAPHSFNLEDADGCNALEYAIANDADMKVIKVMQRTARDEWKTMQAAGQGKTHDEMLRDVKLSADESRMKNVSLSEVIASSVSRRNLGLARSTQSEPDDFCFTDSFVAKSTVVPRRRNLALAKSMGSAPNQGASFIARSA